MKNKVLRLIGTASCLLCIGCAVAALIKLSEPGYDADNFWIILAAIVFMGISYICDGITKN